MSTPPLCHPVKTTESWSYIIPLTENVLHLCRTASSSYFKHVAEMTTLSGVTCDRFYRRTESPQQVILSSRGTVFTFLARSQACSRWASQSSKVVTLPVRGFHGYVSRQSQGLTPQLRDITVLFLLITEKHHLFIIFSRIGFASHICAHCVLKALFYKKITTLPSLLEDKLTLLTAVIAVCIALVSQ